MSETDSFIQEVTEEVRRDRMFAFWKKWGLVIGAVIAVIVAGTALWTWLDHQAEEAARARGALFLETDPADVDAQADLVAEIDGSAAVIAGLRRAAALATSGDREGAVAVWRDIAADETLSAAFRDLALLQALRAEATTGQPSALIAELGPLIATGAPYRLLAMELRAALHLNAGDPGAAHEDLRRILVDPAATEEMRLRAQEVLLATGGAGTGNG